MGRQMSAEKAMTRYGLYNIAVFVHGETFVQTRSSAVAERPRVRRVVKNFTKLLEVVQDH